MCVHSIRERSGPSSQSLLLWFLVYTVCTKLVRNMTCTDIRAETMRVWVRTELLCIHFDAWKVSLETWPIPFVEFKAMIVDKVLEHFSDSRCIFVQSELQGVRNNPKKITRVLSENSRLFIQRGTAKAEEINDLAQLDYDDDVYVCLNDWSGYDTEIVSDESEDESTFFHQNLIEGKKRFCNFVLFTYTLKIAAVFLVEN